MYKFTIVEHESNVLQFSIKTSPSIFSSPNLILTIAIFSTVPFPFISLIFVLFLSINLISIFNSVTQESILVVHGKGIQIEKIYFNNSKEHHFIPFSSIETFVLNEGFMFRRVVYYLCIILKNQKKLILPFSHTLPKLKDCLIVLKRTRKILFNEE
jgi:hypothetical protein